MVRRLQASLARQGVDFLDAPISGGPEGAASGTLAIWVGGDRAVFDRCKPVLDTIGDKVLYVGPIGAGTIAKLVHNVASSAISSVKAEVFTLGAKAGLDPVPLWGGSSPASDRTSRHFREGRLAPAAGSVRSAKFCPAADPQGL